jgi:hypothetical protein
VNPQHLSAFVEKGHIDRKTQKERVDAVAGNQQQTVTGQQL